MTLLICDSLSVGKQGTMFSSVNLAKLSILVFKRLQGNDWFKPFKELFGLPKSEEVFNKGTLSLFALNILLELTKRNAEKVLKIFSKNSYLCKHLCANFLH